MLFFMVFLIFFQVTIVTNKNAGTALFNSAHIKLGCWSVDDIAKLRARKEFEHLLPPPVTPTEVNNRYIRHIIKYFNDALVQVEQDVDRPTAAILREALSDTIGSHLYHEILPSVRFAYYAGSIPFTAAKDAHLFLSQIKSSMNTLGIGWRPPPQIPEWSNLTVAKIAIGSGKLRDPCTYLIYRRDVNNCIHFPTPRTDSEIIPNTMILPFEKLGLVSFTSPESENILLKYYTTASRCILDRSPPHCRHADFLNFNNGLWHWMKHDVSPHLVDDKLYTAFGGVLRIAAAVQNYGKGLTRRNLFENPHAVKWNPWKRLTQPGAPSCSDWTPALYVGVVIFTVLALCLLQACYNYMCGERETCQCFYLRNKNISRIGYTKVESNAFTPTLQSPTLGSTYASVNPRADSRSFPRLSTTTEQVYDLNENKEKVMSIVVSKDDSDLESATLMAESKVCLKEKVKMKQSPRSPPRIDATTSQLKLERPSIMCVNKRVGKPMYSTSSMSHTDVVGPKLHESDSWSVSSTSISDKSDTSTSSTKSHSTRPRNLRDLAWARHVVTRSSRRSDLD